MSADLRGNWCMTELFEVRAELVNLVCLMGR